MHTNLKILALEPDQTKADDIIDALNDGSSAQVTIIPDAHALERSLIKHTPDVILIDLKIPDRRTLEHISLVSDPRARPVAMFVDETNTALTKAAISAGLSAYVVNGMHKDRIKPVLHTAIARFKMTSKLHSDLEAAKQALTDRKTIDRAKGLLMRARQISEDDAYTLLRKTAMDQGRKVIDIATALVTSADLMD